MSQDDAKYTDPERRRRLKEDIQAGDKGGKPGQWSARKAQLLVQRYEADGGGYHDEGHRTESQQHLKDWGEQDWRTQGGEDAGDGGDMSRYLPDAAWKLLTPKERTATDSKKKAGEGQHVANTDAAQEARRAAELLTLTAVEAKKAVAGMDGASQLRRAKKAELKFGKGRKTVLEAIERRLEQV